MGILHLRAFIQSDKVKPRVCKEVCLRQLAEEWRNSGGASVIVADGHNLSRRLQYDFEFMSGGEYKCMVKKLQCLVEAFRAISVDLVIFFGGTSSAHGSRGAEFERSKVFERSNNKKEIEALFRKIDKKPVVYQSSRMLPYLFKRVCREAAFSLTKCVRVSKSRDRYMVEYVIENKCLGILSNDSDLFAFDGIPHIFSRDALDINLMTTLEYSRDALLDVLGLPGEAMPIFSTLMGNDTLLRNDTKKYHEWKFKRSYARVALEVKVPVLAETARNIFLKSHGEDSEIKALLAEEIFGRSKTEPCPPNIMDSLATSLFMYKITPDQRDREPEAVPELSEESSWDQIVKFCLSTLGDFPFGRKSTTILSFLMFIQTPCLESPEVADSHAFNEFFVGLRCMCSSEVLIEFRKRMYSVLLFEKGVPHGEKHFVEELFTTGCRDHFRYDKIEPKLYLASTIPIDVEHPGLYQLWFGNQALEDTRWKLLLWILSTQKCNLINKKGIDVFRGPFYRDHFGLVALTLLYLDQVLHVLREGELKVLLVLAVSVPVMSAHRLTDYFVEYVRKRAASVSTLYQVTWLSVEWASKTCNLGMKSRTWDLYSGMLFHYLFQQKDPTVLLDQLPSEARENYDRLRMALDECSAGD